MSTKSESEIAFHLCPDCETFHINSVVKCTECGFDPKDQEILQKGMDGIAKQISEIRKAVSGREEKQELDNLFTHVLAFADHRDLKFNIINQKRNSKCST